MAKVCLLIQVKLSTLEWPQWWIFEGMDVDVEKQNLKVFQPYSCAEGYGFSLVLRIIKNFIWILIIISGPQGWGHGHPFSSWFGLQKSSGKEPEQQQSGWYQWSQFGLNNATFDVLELTPTNSWYFAKTKGGKWKTKQRKRRCCQLIIWSLKK